MELKMGMRRHSWNTALDDDDFILQLLDISNAQLCCDTEADQMSV